MTYEVKEHRSPKVTYEVKEHRSPKVTCEVKERRSPKATYEVGEAKVMAQDFGSQYSEKVMDHFRNPRNVGVIENPSGIGHVGNPVCVMPGTAVLCNESKRPIENVTEKTRVLSHDGKYHKVKRVFRREYKGSIYKIFVNRLGDITITPEHHVLSVRNYKTKTKNEPFIDWCMVSELKKGDMLLFPASGEKNHAHMRNLRKWNNDYCYSTINKIALLDYEGEVCNLEIEDTRSYATECATLHNCGDIMELYIKVENEIIVDAKFKTFGCLPKDMKVVDSAGLWQNIGEIKKGTTVLNSTGFSTPVAETYTRDYKGPLIYITPFVSPHNSFSLTPNHPVYAVKRKWLKSVRKPSNKCDWLRTDEKELLDFKPDYIHAAQLSKGDYLIYAPCNQTQDQAYLDGSFMKLLGYYLSEGYITAGGSVVAFAFNKKETRYIRHVKMLIAKIIGKQAEIRVRGNVAEVYVCSRELARLLFSKAGKIARNKTLSKDILKLPFHKQWKMLETYIRGDGDFYRRRSKDSLTYRIMTASGNLAVQVQNILARGGIFASIRKLKKTGCAIGGRRLKDSTVYSVVFKKDKKHKFVHKKVWSFLVPIKEVVRRYFGGQVYNFQVLFSPNSYLVKGFAVHNCGAAIATSSMVTELVKGKTVKEALNISNRAVAEALGGLPPVKMHCSLLAEEALKSAITDYLNRSGKKA